MNRRGIYDTNLKMNHKLFHIFNNIACKTTALSYIKLFIILFCVTFLISGGIIIVNAGVKNKTDNIPNRYYTSINIEKNDTLWSIANKYAENPDKVTSYINEIKSINKITDDCIYAGQNIVIYYTPEQ